MQWNKLLRRHEGRDEHFAEPGHMVSDFEIVLEGRATLTSPASPFLGPPRLAVAS
jgi:hypothetical protein